MSNTQINKKDDWVPEAANISTGYALSGDASIFYEVRGNESDPALLMVMGLGAPMTTWTEEFCEALRKQGFRVIRYDNRDVGLSSQTPMEKPPAGLKALIKNRMGLSIDAPYDLDDMSNDAVAVLNHLNVQQAHVMGGSLGGIIAQLCVINHPERFLSLTTLMSTTNERHLPLPKFRIILNLAGIGEKAVVDEDSAVHNRLRYWRLIRSPKFQTPETLIRERALRSYRRAYRPHASAFHTLALLATGSIAERLQAIRVPTLIVHGTDDVFVSPKGAHAIKKRISHARLELIEGMGHEVPNQLVNQFAGWVAEFKSELPQ